MKERQIYITAGLGFGDEGKGSITEFLASEFNAKATIRYNGGPQAAHHIVRPDRSFHCFSQLASSSFLQNVKSHLAHSVLVKPSNLFAELDILNQKHSLDLRSRFSLDPNCYIVTPWHGMLCRMEETVRAGKRHGSVGMGVGKAALDRRNANPNALLIKDCYRPLELTHKLAALWEQSRSAAELMLRENSDNKEAAKIYSACRDGCTPTIMKQEYLNAAKLLEQNLISDKELTATIDGNIILEGAQGVLLDYQFGFLPHVTKTDTTFNSALPYLRTAALDSSTIFKVGILRAYASRHGAGPLVTEDSSLNGKYPEMHNATHPWQGSFRVGHLDLVALRYSMQVSGRPDFLALTQLDLVGKQTSFSVCRSYEYKGDLNPKVLESYFDFEIISGKIIINSIKYVVSPSVSHQLRLTELLCQCAPFSFINFNGWGEKVRSGKELHQNLRIYLDYLESPLGLNCPIKIISYGPTVHDKCFI